jgi:BON domain
MRYKLAAFLAVVLISATALAQVLALPESRQQLSKTEPSARISREVIHQVLMDPYYSVFDNIAFKVEGSHVVLLGEVTKPVLKSDVASSVRNIEGVESVTDNIKVLPLLPTDNRIRHEAFRAIYGFDGLSRYAWGAVPSIHIIVDRGHLTLVGVVDSQADKDMAGMRAKSVPGTFSVVNDLRVGSSAVANGEEKPAKEGKKG